MMTPLSSMTSSSQLTLNFLSSPLHSTKHLPSLFPGSSKKSLHAPSSPDAAAVQAASQKLKEAALLRKKGDAAKIITGQDMSRL
jgi:hypothetical protein